MLPVVMVFHLGLILVISQVAATVLAADSRHLGIASGVNNAVSYIAGVLAVAVLPLISRLAGRRFYDPRAMTWGFHDPF